MAELTTLESKLGEVLGLAMAAQEATKKIEKLAEEENGDLVQTLERMRNEAQEAEHRGTELASSFEGKKTAILEEARETKSKASEMMSTYLDRAADALDGFEFLTMAEAAEVGHWSVLKVLNERARHAGIQQFVEWGLPIQERHLEEAMSGTRELAAEQDPSESA